MKEKLLKFIICGVILFVSVVGYVCHLFIVVAVEIVFFFVEEFLLKMSS